MINEQDVARYQREGFIVVPDVVSAQEIAELRRVTDEFVEQSRQATEHTELFDLEDGHSASEPRMTAVPVRVPYPAAPHQGSIYENQRELATRYFKDADETAKLT